MEGIQASVVPDNRSFTQVQRIVIDKTGIPVLNDIRGHHCWQDCTVDNSTLLNSGG
jgi:hypothetical protein